MMERSELHKTLKRFDIAIVPLTTRIYGSVPSKIFEYGSLGFPILYFGGGEGEKPYLPLTCLESWRDLGVPEREPEHRCCMAVVSSCREMLG